MKQNYKNKFFHLAGLLFFAFTVNAQVTTFNYTGGVQTYMVPAGVTSVNIKTWGAQGVNGGGAFGGEAGLGGYAEGVATVTPGEILNIYVGGTSGYNGGVAGGNIGTGNGGGASDVRQDGVALGDRIIVAGGESDTPFICLLFRSIERKFSRQ